MKSPPWSENLRGVAHAHARGYAAAALERERVARDMTRRQLAQRAGVDPATVWRVEVGRVAPHPMTRAALAAALEVDPARVFPEGDTP